MRTRTLFWTLALCLVALVAVASPAVAQTTDTGKWEVELHGGGMSPTNPTRGTVTLPGPGQVFTPAAFNNPRSSRRESSWYFGDGAILFKLIGLRFSSVAGKCQAH